MTQTHCRLFLSFIVPIALVLGGGERSVFSSTMSMEEIHKRFKRENRKKWEDATRIERVNFLYKMRGKEKKEERQERVKGVKIPYHIREGFYREHGKKWEQASEAEQEEFIKIYKNRLKELDIERLIKKKEAEIRAKEIEIEKHLKKVEAKRRKQARAIEKKLEKEALKRKREEEKRKVLDSRRKRNLLLQKLKEPRDRDRARQSR